MNRLLLECVSLILPFVSLFSKRTWHSALVLIAGAILATGKGTVSAGLRVIGLSQKRHLQNYHRVLNRAVWSSRKASQILLNQLIAVFAPSGVLVMGILVCQIFADVCGCQELWCVFYSGDADFSRHLLLQQRW